jgi:hypothetical protein
MVWRGHHEPNYAAVCPADVRWNLLFLKVGNRVHVSVEGATTQYVPKTRAESAEFLVIKFALGVFMPYLSPGALVDTDAHLPEKGSSRSFWLDSAGWELPTFDNVEVFVQRLIRSGALVVEPVVESILQNQLPDVSSRTVRRRFVHSTGLTPKLIQQIERANRASALLSQGVPILDVVYEAGYADQPHMTRSLRRFIGHTPAQIAENEP